LLHQFKLKKKNHSWLIRSLGFDYSSFRPSKDLRYRFAKLDEGCKDIIFMVVMVIPWCGTRSQGVRANVQPESSISIGAKVEISPKSFTRGVKA
jgi:hypothetical protein